MASSSKMASRRVAEAEIDDLDLAAIGGGLDADDDIEQDLSQTPQAVEPIEDPVTAEAERQTEKATLATLGNTNHPNFAEEMKLLAEMLETAEWARHQPDEKLKKLFGYIDQNMPWRRLGKLEQCPVERTPHPHFHRIRRHAQLRPAAARGSYPIIK